MVFGDKQISSKICIDGIELENVEKFTYLGSNMTYDLSTDHWSGSVNEIKRMSNMEATQLKFQGDKTSQRDLMIAKGPKLPSDAKKQNGWIKIGGNVTRQHTNLSPTVQHHRGLH